jgi:FixJ family two-component response regulator
MTHFLPTVFVVEDDANVREALQELLRSAGYRVRSFPSTAEFLREWSPGEPACLILDVCLQEESGLAFQRSLIQKNTRIPIVFITGHGDIRMAVQAIKAGAVEFLTKPLNDEDLLNAVQRSIKQDESDRSNSEELRNLRKRLDSLTSREAQVLRMVVSGLLNKQIAGKLGISEITVKIHRGQMMRKMGASSLADLAGIAERLHIQALNTSD